MLEQRKRNIVQKDEINLLYGQIEGLQNLLQGQIEGLQKQNAELQKENKEAKKYKEMVDKISDKISAYIKDNCDTCKGVKYGGCDKCEINQILNILIINKYAKSKENK